MTIASLAIIARWVARAWSILNLGIVLVFVVGQIVGSGGRAPTLPEWVGLAFWPIGVGVGLILAWFCETLGGSIALACVIAFYTWNLLRSGHLARGPFFFLFGAPALLFLVAGFLPRRNADSGA